MTVSQSSARAELLCDIIRVLQQEDHELCILHGYTEYPEVISSDVDAISGEPEAIPHIIAKRKIARLVQVLQHEATAFYYVFAQSDGKQFAFLDLDVSMDYRRNGRVFFKGEEFLKARQAFKFFQVPAPELEFAYYMVKKVAKGELDSQQAQRLSELYREAPTPCQTQLSRFFPETESQLIADAAQNQDWALVNNQMQHLRQAMLGKVRRNSLLNVCQYWLGELRRLLNRILQPTGVMVVVLGTDGAGKSTVIEQVREHLSPAFRRTQYVHLRPRLGIAETDNNSPVVDPHGQLPRSGLTSILKLIYFLLDYGVGYVVKIYSLLVKSTFVVFDRYYHDLLVDPKRYRYGGPIWLARLIGKVIPKPDLWILLDAPAEVLQSRKQEVTFDETVRQREAYIELIQHLPNSHIVNAALPIEQVVSETEQLILSFMQNRTSKRLGIKNPLV